MAFERERARRHPWLTPSGEAKTMSTPGRDNLVESVLGVFMTSLVIPFLSVMDDSLVAKDMVSRFNF